MSNLLPLDKIWGILVDKGLDEYAKKIEYATYPKKYKVTLHNDSVVRFGH